MSATQKPALQNLPLHGAKLCLDMERFAARVLERDFADLSLVVAVSGGADSTALLLLLCALRSRNRFDLTAAHLNHGLRPEADKDALFVAKLCTDLGINLVSEKVDVAGLSREQGKGLEETARIARYEFLEKTRRDNAADIICIGHHLDDLAEDQLLRLLRGTGWPGLSGMSAFDPDRSLLRPLLQTAKTDLTTLLRSLDQNWREDASNKDTSLLRNRVRHEILPLFLRDNPAYLKAAARLWDMGRADEEHWSGLARDAVQTAPDGGLFLALPGVRDRSRAERLRLYKEAVERLGPGQALADNLFQLDRLVMDKKTGSETRFPGDKRAVVEPARVHFIFINRTG